MAYPDVRRAQPDHQSAVGDLWAQLLEEQEAMEERFGVAEDARDRWENDFPQWLDDETYRVYVAEVDGEVVGFATAHRWGPPPIYAESSEVFIDELYVRPDDRRQGLGSQLVQAVRDWTGRIGAQRLRLNVLAANEEARAFWAAQEARPLTVTLAVEHEGAEDATDDEGSKKIGF
ncbi:GNAT family N-acetyltransferase [Salinibacter ruber]|uniref:GNAT family N-acetyltransferase n=1 Tax=Salinibacter ruber TaxID=146919 RepID=UPI0020740D38|nr:GNAT family N-acetyltransferase [Salinibacter ruber]MCS3698156.1 GNAT superfamily N-acetyltransferase [Salinibacter ruber]